MPTSRLQPLRPEEIARRRRLSCVAPSRMVRNIVESWCLMAFGGIESVFKSVEGNFGM